MTLVLYAGHVYRCDDNHLILPITYMTVTITKTRYPKLELTVLDFENVVGVGREFAAKEGEVSQSENSG